MTFAIRNPGRGRNIGTLADVARTSSGPKETPLTMPLSEVESRYASSSRKRFYYIGQNPDRTRDSE